MTNKNTSHTFPTENKKAVDMTGKSPGSRKGLENIQIRQPDGTTKPPAPGKNKQNNTHNLKHGAYSEAITAPLVEAKKKELQAIIEEAKVPFILSIDTFLITGLARSLVRLERFDAYLEEHGDVISKTKMNPVIKVYFTALETARRHCESLGLSPSTRARLGVDMAKHRDLVEKMAERTPDDR